MNRDLTLAVFSQANLDGADLTDSILVDADLSFANLSNASMGGADLTSASLFGADLNFAFLTNTVIEGTRLTNADFTGLSPKGRELYITHVLHKAFVDVNEEGTEAAAATAVVIGRKGGGGPKEFRADRPFLFLIQDESTGAILFMGRVADPR